MKTLQNQISQWTVTTNLVINSYFEVSVNFYLITQINQATFGTYDGRASE